MIKGLIFVATLAIVPTAAFAQNSQGAQGGALSGGVTGAVGGAIVGGPIGAVVGGVGGAIVGGIIGDNTPRFQTYVFEQEVPSYSYAEPVEIGTILPERGVAYREVPAEYGATEYRYTVVNNRTVLVEPRTRRIVQVIQ